MENNISIKPSFVFKDYFKVYLYLYINRPYFYVVTSVIILVVSVNLYGQIYYGNPIQTIPILIAVAYPIFLLFFIYSQTKKILSNEKLKENISIEFNTEYMEDKGESFHMRYFWKDILKIVEKRNWFLIYVNKDNAKVIRKADLKENQYQELKNIFNSLDIKKKLK